MCFDSEGLSPSQMIAVWSPRLWRCRSTQFQATLRTPSSNHLMEISPGAKGVFSTLVKGFIQPMRLACSAQNPFGSLTDRAYISWYWPESIYAPLAQTSGTSYIFSDIRSSTLAASERSTNRLQYCSD